MAEKAAPQPPATSLPFKQVNRPDIAETFVDAITGVVFDGQTLRIEGGVTRIERTEGAANAATACRYTACRLVLTPNAAVELINQIQQVTAKLVQSGILKSDPPKGDLQAPTAQSVQ